jgi:hypothetical protein
MTTAGLQKLKSIVYKINELNEKTSKDQNHIYDLFLQASDIFASDFLKPDMNVQLLIIKDVLVIRLNGEIIDIE